MIKYAATPEKTNTNTVRPTNNITLIFFRMPYNMREKPMHTRKVIQIIGTQSKYEATYDV